MDKLSLDKYHYLLLDIIASYNKGNGVGIPTIDRLFYTRIDDIELEDVYSVQWIPRARELSEAGLIKKVPSGKGDMITSQGKKTLELYNESQA